MANIEELSKAIGAHGLWKMRLKTMIDTGKFDTPIETIRMDDHCAFGEWLYGATITPKEKTTTHYKTVKELHAEFHKTAARVAEFAAAGNKAAAERMLGNGGEFAAISTKLVNAIMAWKKEY